MAGRYTTTSIHMDYYNGDVSSEANNVAGLAALGTTWLKIGSPASDARLCTCCSGYGLAADASSNWIASDQLGDGNNFALYAISGVLTKSPIGADDYHPDVSCIAFLLVVSRRLHLAANQPTC